MWKSFHQLEKLNTYRASSSSTPHTQSEEYFMKYMRDQRYKLGNGSFGSVYRIDQGFTLKKLNNDITPAHVYKCLENEKDVINYMIEKKIEHENLVKVFFTKDKITIYEFLFGTIGTINFQFSHNLLQFIENVSPDVSLCFILKGNFFKQIYDGLSHLHENNIYHRDLKPDNIMITGNLLGGGTIKIIDYNLAYLFEPEKDNKNLFLPGTIGARGYRSPIATGFDTSNPEECKMYFVLSDIWSLVITFYKLIYINIILIKTKEKQTYIDYLSKNIVSEGIKLPITNRIGYDFDFLLHFVLVCMCGKEDSLTTLNFRVVISQVMNIIKIMTITSYNVNFN